MKKSTQDKGVWVVIPASGVGSRMHSDIPKQYLQVHGKTILEHTINRFVSLPAISGILVVVSELDNYWADLKNSIQNKYQSELLTLASTFGGDERSGTVLKGLSYLLNEKGLKPEQWLMVHDAVRPCVREKDILKLLDARFNSGTGGAMLGVPVKDTLKQANPNKQTITKTLSREGVWHAQTPQLFQLGALFDALHKAKRAKVLITDEASAMEFSNQSVQLIEGSSDNIKLTTPTDLKLIEYLLDDSEETNGL